VGIDPNFPGAEACSGQICVASLNDPPAEKNSLGQIRIGSNWESNAPPSVSIIEDCIEKDIVDEGDSERFLEFSIMIPIGYILSS
jgi:hypothetical protein